MKIKKYLLIESLIVILLTLFAFTITAENRNYRVGNRIEFGTYPQTEVLESDDLKNAANAAKWVSYNYYTGTGNTTDGKMKPSDCMLFADFFVGEEKYRAVILNDYRPGGVGMSSGSKSHQQENGYYLNHIYYFKYEPLIWRILDPETGYIMCEKLIDTQSYQNVVYSMNERYWQGITSSICANNYNFSSIRRWLNYDFFKTAFTDEQKKYIVPVSVPKSPSEHSYYKETGLLSNYDYVSILSFADAQNNDYGFTSFYQGFDRLRTARATDYARCQGIESLEKNGWNSWWWLRDSGSNSGNVCGVSTGGNVGQRYFVGNIGGVRPVCIVSELINDNKKSSFLLSSHNHVEGEYLVDNRLMASCTEKGIRDEMTYCSICGQELKRESIETDPLGHKYELCEIIDAKCSEDGQKIYVCKYDATHTRTETIPATGNHEDADNNGYCDTCEEMMQGGQHCKFCGKIHDGLFGWLVKFFHSILAIFKR